MRLLDARLACDWFFDRDHMVARLSAGKRAAMNRTGAVLRLRARDKIRRRRGRSKPGEPPNSHAKGFASLRRIFYQWEPEAEALVVGPVKLTSRLPPPDGFTVPEVLEFGGPAKVTRDKVVEVEPRPFMGPTLDESAEVLIDFWAGVVTDG